MGRPVKKRPKKLSLQEAKEAKDSLVEEATGALGLDVYTSKKNVWINDYGFNLHLDVTDENCATMLSAEFARLRTYSSYKTTAAFISRLLLSTSQPAFNKTTFHIYPALTHARECITKNPDFTRDPKSKGREFEDEDCIYLLYVTQALYFVPQSGWISHNDEALLIALVVVLCVLGSFRSDDLNYIHSCDVDVSYNTTTKKWEAIVEMVNRDGDKGAKNGKKKLDVNNGKSRTMRCAFVCCCSDPDIEESFLMNPTCAVHILKIYQAAIPLPHSNIKLLRHRHAKSQKFTKTPLGVRNHHIIAERMNDLLPSPFPDAPPLTLKSLKRNGITNKLALTNGNTDKVAQTTRHLEPTTVLAYEHNKTEQQKLNTCREVSALMGDHYNAAAANLSKVTREKIDRAIGGKPPIETFKVSKSQLGESSAQQATSDIIHERTSDQQPILPSDVSNSRVSPSTLLEDDEDFDLLESKFEEIISHTADKGKEPLIPRQVPAEPLTGPRPQTQIPATSSTALVPKDTSIFIPPKPQQPRPSQHFLRNGQPARMVMMRPASSYMVETPSSPPPSNISGSKLKRSAPALEQDTTNKQVSAPHTKTFLPTKRLPHIINQDPNHKQHNTITQSGTNTSTHTARQGGKQRAVLQPLSMSRNINTAPPTSKTVEHNAQQSASHRPCQGTENQPPSPIDVDAKSVSKQEQSTVGNNQLANDLLVQQLRKELEEAREQIRRGHSTSALSTTSSTSTQLAHPHTNMQLTEANIRQLDQNAYTPQYANTSTGIIDTQHKINHN